MRSLGAIPRTNRAKVPIRRYYLKGKRDKIAVGDRDDVDRLDEDAFISQNRTFNKRLAENPADIAVWSEFVRHQDKTSQKATKLQIAERKMEILDKALRENVSNDALYEMYVDVLDRTYPSFEVSKMLDGLLAKGLAETVLIEGTLSINRFAALHRSYQLHALECPSVGQPRLDGPMHCAGCAEIVRTMHEAHVQ